MGKEEEARESYEKVTPLLEEEPRCARVDWERHSLWVNIGNTYSRTGNFELADKHYQSAELLGNDHLNETGGSESDGKGMVACAKRARAFALKKAGRLDEAKVIMKTVVEQQIKDNLEAEKKEAEEKAAKETE
jgi:tetratricopeptide (TPR) repeat protein